jgi:hypothetical protein
MSATWVPVFYGSVPEVLVLQETLNANAIPSLAPELEHLDTATLGGSVYSVRLLVPPDLLESARSHVPASKRGGIPALVSQPAGGDGKLEALTAHTSATKPLPSGTRTPEELGGEA